MKLNYLIAALLLPGFLWAQSPEKNKEVEQIIITKKGAASERLNIIVDGETVTVNGQPVNKNDKDADLTITRRKIKDMDVWMDDKAPIERRIVRGYPLPPQAPVPPMPPNKAMLGLATTKTEDGVKVMNVTKESAADIAGMKEGDIIKEVEMNKIEKPDDLSKAIRDKNPGDKVTVVYLRDNKQYTTVAELKKWEALEMPMFENIEIEALPGFDMEEFRGRLGDIENQRGNMRQFRVQGFPLNRPRLGIKIQDVEAGSGVKVIGVEEGSDAAKAGMKEGDIIKEVDGKTVTGADDMRMKVLDAKPGAGMEMKLERNGRTQNVKVQFSKKIKTADL